MLAGMELINAIRSESAHPPSGISTLGLDQTHKWLNHVTPGEVSMSWPVDDKHLNLEGAVICSWTVAIADQALFLASNTLCNEGQGTRLGQLHLDARHNMNAGELVNIRAQVITQAKEQMFGVCTFHVDDQLCAAVNATIEIIDTETVRLS